MTEHHFSTLSAAERTIQEWFDTTPCQVVLVFETPRDVRVLTDLTSDDLAATLLLDGDVLVYAYLYHKRRDPWYTPTRKNTRHVYKYALKQRDRLSATVPLRVTDTLSPDFKPQDLFAHAMFYAAFGLWVYVLRDAVAYTVTLTQPSTDAWENAPDGSALYCVAQNAHLGAVSHHYVNRKDEDARPLLQ